MDFEKIRQDMLDKIEKRFSIESDNPTTGIAKVISREACFVCSSMLKDYHAQLMAELRKSESK